MTPQLWIGLLFLAALVGFLIYSILQLPTLTDDQRARIKFLTALCAGFAGGFLTGDALFKLQQTTGSTNVAVSGTAGCALFFLVWFFYPKVFQLKDGMMVSIPKGWAFTEGAKTIAQLDTGRVLDYVGFEQKELDAILQEQKLSFPSVAKGLALLRLVTVERNVIRDYEVIEDGSVFRLKIR